jgi:hypothetical protein
MSLDITLEADSRLTRCHMKKVLELLGATQTDEADVLTAFFPESNMGLLYRDTVNIAEHLTDGFESATWPVQSRATFRLSAAHYDKCMEDLRKFLENLSELTEAFFTVAFQYERLLAYRNDQGLNFVE